MAYGRLDVFFPDGEFRTYLLTEPTISIGRSTGSSIPLETESISRYHLSIRHVDGQTTITDLESANGSFVDGVRLKVNTPQSLYGGEEIIIGDLRLIFHNLDDSPTRPIIVPEAITQRIEVAEPTFKIDLPAPEHPIAPGSHTSVTLTITATGDEPDHYLVEVIGLPKGWVRLDRSDVALAPGASAEVIISFKPTRRPESAPGDYAVEVVVRPRNAPDHALRGTVTLRVLPYGGLGVALASHHLEDDGYFRLYLHNQGSVPQTLSLAGRAGQRGLRVRFPNPQVTLAPGQQIKLVGRAVAPRRIVGGGRDYVFDILVRSCDQSNYLIPLRAYWTERALLPTWAGFAVTAILIALITLLVLGLNALLTPPPTPVIEQFSVVPMQVEQGTPLSVNWQARNIDSLSILVGGTPIYGVTPNAGGAMADMGSLEAQTGAQTGAVAVVVQANNGNRQALATAMVEVLPALQVGYFDVQPLTLTRYVVQTLTINWNAPGAATTQISGLERFTSAPGQGQYGASGTISMAGIPLEDTLTLRLRADSIDGRQVERSLTLNVIDPTCRANLEGITIYSAPDSRSALIGTARLQEMFVVDAQDATGQWLRVTPVDGLPGWAARSTLACEATFDIDNLRKEVNFPPQMPIAPTVPAPESFSADQGEAASAGLTFSAQMAAPPTAAPPISLPFGIGIPTPTAAG